MENIEFIAECQIFDKKVYSGKEFFTITSAEVTDDTGKVIGYKYAVHITETDQQTNIYREYMAEYKPKVTRYNRESENKTYLWEVME